jgi:hypothetical protein
MELGIKTYTCKARNAWNKKAMIERIKEEEEKSQRCLPWKAKLR